MQPFDHAHTTTKEHVATPPTDKPAIRAGGTDLLALMKDDVVAPNRLVNIKQLDPLRGIAYQPGNGLRLGALARLAEIADAATGRQHYPVLAEAAIEAASPQIRNLATLGGNMCQRPRDWYFRNGFGLLASEQSHNGVCLLFPARSAPRFASTRRSRQARACANCRSRNSSSSPQRRASASTTSG